MSNSSSEKIKTQSSDRKHFDLEERLINFAVRIIL
jgi:hypothetical protein